jgi:hypothetical protein
MGDLSNLKISNTYSRLLQADPDTNQLQDGVGNNPSSIIFNGTTLKYVDGNQQNNYILTSDANGVARWAENSGGGGGDTNVYWSASSLNANAIVNSGMTNSKVGIGTLIPNHTLTVSGTVSGSSHFYGGGDMTLIRNLSVGNDLVVTGNTVMNGTLSATTSLKVGNGDGSVSAATITGNTLVAGGRFAIGGGNGVRVADLVGAVDRIAYGYDGALRHYTYGKSLNNIHGFTGSTFMFGNGAGTLSSTTINAETINGTTVEGTIDGGTF